MLLYAPVVPGLCLTRRESPCLLLEPGTSHGHGVEEHSLANSSVQRRQDARELLEQGSGAGFGAG